MSARASDPQTPDCQQTSPLLGPEIAPFSYIERGEGYGLIARDDTCSRRVPVIETPFFAFGDMKLLVCNL